MADYKDEWLPLARAFLEAEGCDPEQVLQGARLALMLAEHGESAVVRVALRDNRVAWCRTFSNGWGCVAIAPRGDRWDADSVPRAEFFATRWPSTWKTTSAVRKAARAEADTQFVQGGMAWANDPAGVVRVARVESVEPLALALAPGHAATLAADTGMTWRHFMHNAAGLETEWREGRATFHNFRLAAMRAGLRVKHAANAKPRKVPETAEARAARIARWAAACMEGRKRAKARRDAATEAAKEAARQNVQDGS